jgi:hypothetical protein
VPCSPRRPRSCSCRRIDQSREARQESRAQGEGSCVKQCLESGLKRMFSPRIPPTSRRWYRGRLKPRPPGRFAERLSRRQSRNLPPRGARVAAVSYTSGQGRAVRRGRARRGAGGNTRCTRPSSPRPRAAAPPCASSSRASSTACAASRPHAAQRSGRPALTGWCRGDPAGVPAGHGAHVLGPAPPTTRSASRAGVVGQCVFYHQCRQSWSACSRTLPSAKR